MNEKKILKAFGKWIDDQINFKDLVGGLVGAGVELVDGPVFSVAINVAYSKVPREHQAEVLQVFQTIESGNYEALEKVSIEKIVDLLKTPLGDSKERIILGGVVDMVFALIKETKNSVVD